MTEDSLNHLPIPKGMMNVWIGPKEIWKAKFPIRLNPMNAAVRKHFAVLPMQDVQCVSIENTAGFIRYRLSINGRFDIGFVCLQEMPDGHSTELIIVPPRSKGSGWTQEEKRIIDSKPDRASKKKVMYEMAVTQAAEREEILKWQGLVFNVFLQQLTSDTAIAQAMRLSSGCFEDFAKYIKGEMRMSFWQLDKGSQCYKWISHPEKHAKELLLTFLNGRFGSSIYAFEEIRSGAGCIDVLIIMPDDRKVIVELKMCGNHYSKAYATGGIEQLNHYLENKNAQSGYLVVFDSRSRDFSKGLQSNTEIIAGLSVTTIVVDVRPYVKKKEVGRPSECPRDKS